jgi:hypothetical protein
MAVFQRSFGNDSTAAMLRAYAATLRQPTNPHGIGSKLVGNTEGIDSPHNACQCRDHCRSMQAALAQNAQEEAAVEIVEWQENASPRLRFFTKVSNLPAGTKLYTHAERARVPDGWREAILAVIDALDKATGDSDPNIDPDMTDKEVRDEYPEVWSMQQLTAMIAAPSQPAQTVDVGAIREVIHYLQDEGNACMATGDGLDAQWGSRILSMSRKLTRAISGKPL